MYIKKPAIMLNATFPLSESENVKIRSGSKVIAIQRKHVFKKN